MYTKSYGHHTNHEVTWTLGPYVIAERVIPNPRAVMSTYKSLHSYWLPFNQKPLVMSNTGDKAPEYTVLYFGHSDKIYNSYKVIKLLFSVVNCPQNFVK